MYSYFYPRSPCGERPGGTGLSADRIRISIHALLAESDQIMQRPAQRLRLISIHALLAESDLALSPVRPFSAYFYPRSPCGERHSGNGNLASHCNFYPRSPCGERPVVPVELTTLVKFLSTLSLRRATINPLWLMGYDVDFYPRSPCGERRMPKVVQYRQ